MGMIKRTIRLAALAAGLTLVLASALPAEAQTFEEAVAAYQRGDYAAAHRGFRSLAEQGNAVAQVMLGRMHLVGEGVPQNYAEAVKWFRRAAEQGDIFAQNSLGFMYANGKGVSQDYAEAVKWHRRAAESGDAAGQFMLGSMYEAGHGVPQDHVRAHMWYNLAASRFTITKKESRESAEQAQIAERARDRVAQFLSPEALARAQRMASEWRPAEARAE